MAENKKLDEQEIVIREGEPSISRDCDSAGETLNLFTVLNEGGTDSETGE